MQKNIFWGSILFFYEKKQIFRRFFLLFTTSIRSRPPGPPAVPGVITILLLIDFGSRLWFSSNIFGSIQHKFETNALCKTIIIVWRSCSHLGFLQPLWILDLESWNFSVILDFFRSAVYQPTYVRFSSNFKPCLSE